MRGSVCLVAVVLFASPFGLSTHAQPPGPADRGAFQIRLGGFFPSGGGEFWNESEEVFTVDSSDFDDLILGFGYVHSINNYVELGFGADFFEGDATSEYRDFVDEDDFPILHDSALRTVPLTVDLRFLPGGRYRIRAEGRRVMKPVFYVGGGIGTTLWEYEEIGDFLDFGFDPPEIFFDRFRDSGAAFEVHGLAGIELPLSSRVNLLAEGRYSAADDELQDDFAGLGKIELGGPSIQGGVSFRF